MCTEGDNSLSEPFELAEIKAGIKDGGKILGAFIVARTTSDGKEIFVVYFRTDWTQSRTFRILCRFRSDRPKTFKRLDRLYEAVRGTGYTGRIIIFPSGDSELQKFSGVLPEDGEGLPHPDGDDGD